jgi:hypothetical protein
MYQKCLTFPKGPKVFKFVNKDTKSGARPPERPGQAGKYEINRHVQRVRHLERHTKLLRETSSTKRLVGWQKAPAERGRGTGHSDANSRLPVIPCQFCRIPHAGVECPSHSVDAPIGSASDPFQSLILPIDIKIHRILQYYMTLRQPRGSTADSNIAGFTPLGKQDEQLSLRVVKTSLSSPNDLHAISLIAGMACRMKFVSADGFFNIFACVSPSTISSKQEQLGIYSQSRQRLGPSRDGFQLSKCSR